MFLRSWIPTQVNPAGRESQRVMRHDAKLSHVDDLFPSVNSNACGSHVDLWSANARQVL